MALEANDVRLFVRDRPEYNRLLGDVEFTQEQIDQAMKLTVMLYNEMPPLSHFTLKNFPYNYVLLYGTVWHLLFGGGLLRSRNRLAYQTGGTSVDDEAHSDVELQLSNQLKAEFTKLATERKIEDNARRGWGTVYSEYARLGNYYPGYRR